MKVRVELIDLPTQDIDSDGELSIEVEDRVLAVVETKPDGTDRALAAIAPGAWVSAHIVTDES